MNILDDKYHEEINVHTTEQPLEAFEVSLEHLFNLTLILLQLMWQELQVFDGSFNIYAWENITVPETQSYIWTYKIRP